MTLRPGAPLLTWLLFQLLAASGRAADASALAAAAAAAAPHEADMQALVALARAAETGLPADAHGVQVSFD